MAQGPLTGGRQQLLRAKLDFLRWSVSDRQLAKIEEPRHLWDRRFKRIAIAEALGYDVSTTATQNNAISDIARKLGGQRRITPSQLDALAIQVTLVTAERDAKPAGHMLADTCSFEDFRRALISSGWADPEAALRSRAMSRQLLIEAFRPFGLRRGGLRMGDDVTIAAAAPADIRGMRPPRPEDRERLQDIPLRTQVGFVIDDLSAARGLLLLEIGSAPGREGAYPVTSLVPSVLAPDCRVEPGQLLPTQRHHGIDRFVANGPPGEYDWLAILTREPLSPRWLRGSDDFYRLSQQDLEWLLGALGREARDAPAALEVRHHPFTIGMEPL